MEGGMDGRQDGSKESGRNEGRKEGGKYSFFGKPCDMWVVHQASATVVQPTFTFDRRLLMGGWQLSG